MVVSVDAIKELRGITAASIAECKKALHETGGDVQKAVTLLRKRGLEIAAAKQDRVAKDGRIEAYVHHGNKIGVLLEVDCESDFVAKNSDFAQFTKDVAMHIAAIAPTYVKKEDVPAEVIEQEKNKEDFYKHNCLLEQPFVKDPSITIKDYVGSIVTKIGENVIVRRFTRYQIGR
ncbi:MAG: elongation factor Ts [Candidatus Omnitrophica bacterium]|nr:elongation factor Ts [Candidatus Omnitrophota bacterium]